jgi:hypothetical protein
MWNPARVILPLMLCLAAPAIAQSPDVLLQKDAAIRVWSPRHGLAGRKGFISSRGGDTLNVRFPAPARLETDPLWETMTLLQWEIDSIDVQQQGRWWRATFADTVIRAVNEPPPVGSRLALVPMRTPVRVTSRANHLDQARGVLVGHRADSIDVDFSSGAGTLTRALAERDLDRVEIPTHHLDYGSGAWHGFAIGATVGVATALIAQQCNENSGCTVVPPQAATYGIGAGGAGIIAGLLAARWTHSRWKVVPLR